MTGGVCGADASGRGGCGLHRGWDTVHHGREHHHHRREVSDDQLVRVSADRTTATDLTIVTAEGDRVTLSSTTTAHVGYAGYTHLGASQGQRVALQAEAATVDVGQQLQLSVDGDLNEQEQADIQRLLGLLAGGDVGGALAEAQPSGELSSLAGFSLSVSQTTRLEVAQAQRLQASVAA